jgi:cytochrome c oxidase cbb3-type subunit 4
MHAFFGTASGIITALLIVLFAGLVGWAWSDARRASFDASARVPLEEDAGLVRTDREHSSEHRA